MAPVILALKETGFVVEVLNTGQHGDLMQPVLDIFHLEIDHQLCVMESNSTLSGLTQRILEGASDILTRYNPDIVFVHGDTTTCLSVALAAFYENIPIVHVEAGLRSGRLDSPWPEEANRRLTDAISSIHIAPTNTAKDNLMRENINPDSIFVTGNTGVDAFIKADSMIESGVEVKTRLNDKHSYLQNYHRNILITIHRRENIGKNLRNICEAVRIIKDKNPDVGFVIPVHPNPSVKSIIKNELDGILGIKLIKPQGYLDFIYLVRNSYLVLTDSGGVQEEAPSLNKPVLVLRDTTERPEGIDSGCSFLVGTESNNIITGVQEFLEDEEKYNLACNSINPYGDGKSTVRIINIIRDYMI